MRFRDKGFTLVELIITVAVAAILIAVAVPSFIGIIARTSADSEISELYRAFNYARSEAINRSVAVRVVPVTNNLWTSTTNVQVGQVANATTLLRVTPAMRQGALINAASVNGPAAYIEFNNLGALNFPLAEVVIRYTRGTQERTLRVGLNGRVSRQ
jgi:type IV fimbrial biogenesis protein FimU